VAEAAGADVTDRRIQFTWTEEQAATVYAALRALLVIANNADRNDLVEAVDAGAIRQGLRPDAELEIRMAFLMNGNALTSTRLTTLEDVLKHLALWLRESPDADALGAS
jgi:hypothetical protein